MIYNNDDDVIVMQPVLMLRIQGRSTVWHNRVSHNQGYHLICTWRQKWKFIYGLKNNWTWKSIDYSVWNQNIAELSLIFIEL